MPIHEIAALSASFCFAIGGLFAVAPSRALGAIRFNRVRMLIMGVALSLVAWATGGFGTLVAHQLPLLVLSGLIGITLGDTFLFAGLRRVGPRRNAIMFALNAPLAALLGVWLLDEFMAPAVWLGCIAVTGGVLIAIAFGRRRSGENPWDVVYGSLPAGLFFGFLAAVGQAGGILLSRPVMEAGVDPIAASAVRVGVGCLALWLTYEIQHFGRVRDHSPWTSQYVLRTAASGIVGMGLGMTFVMYALSGAKAGLVATLSSAAPVILLPLMWLFTGRAPAWGAWVGACVVVAGTALVFSTR